MKITFERKTLAPLPLIIVLHLFWLTIGIMGQRFLNGDSEEYIFLAKNLKNGIYYCGDLTLPIIDYNLTSRPPVYSLLLLGSYTLFGFTHLPLILIQNVLSIASCMIMLSLFRKLFPSSKKEWIYLLLLAFYPAQMCFATVLAPDTILQFLLALYLRELLFSIKDPGNKRMAGMALLLLIATLTKPIIYPFLFLHLIYALWCFFRAKKILVIAFGIMPLIGMVGYGLWNKSRTNLYHISSIQNNNLLNSNVRLFLTFEYGQAYSDSVLLVKNKALENQIGLKAKYEYADSISKDIIKAQPLKYVVFHLKESIRFFIDPGKYDLDIYLGQNDYLQNEKSLNFYKELKEHGAFGVWNYLKSYPFLPLILLIILFNILRILGWIFFLYDKRYPLALKLISGIYILYFAVITGPVANTRYFLPILLLMSGLSMVGFSGLMKKRKINITSHTKPVN